MDTDNTLSHAGDCPFDFAEDGEGCYHVFRWEGKETDGAESDFVRKGGKLVVRDGATPDRSSLLTEEIHFGKHEGTPWGEIPTGYLVWMATADCENRSHRRNARIAKDVLILRGVSVELAKHEPRKKRTTTRGNRCIGRAKGR